MNLPKKIKIVVLLLYPVLMFPKNSRLQWCSTMGGTESAVGWLWNFWGVPELEERMTVYYNQKLMRGNYLYI